MSKILMASRSPEHLVVRLNGGQARMRWAPPAGRLAVGFGEGARHHSGDCAVLSYVITLTVWARVLLGKQVVRFRVLKTHFPGEVRDIVEKFVKELNSTMPITLSETYKIMWWKVKVKFRVEFEAKWI
jgi:hypothetical protein